MASKKDDKTPRNNGTEGTPRTSARLRLKAVKVEDECEDDTHGPAGMSLDVLAQVASETLENEPHSPKKGRHKKLSLRSIQSLDVLTLEQIQELTERTIIRLFSEVTSNELSRKFTYTCQLMPKQCQQYFSSFGSDMRSRAEMKKHLYRHLDELAIEENGPKKTKFTAEPVHVRKKRMLNAVLPARRKKGRPRNLDELESMCARRTDIPVALESDFTHIKDGINDEEMQTISKGIESYLQNQKHQAADNEQASLLSQTVNVQSLPVQRQAMLSTRSRTPKHRYWPTVKGLKKSSSGEGADLSDLESDSDTERKIEENEQFIIDLLGKRQPHLDHNYTTIFGKRKGADMVHHMQDSDDDGKEEGDIDVGDNVVLFMEPGGKTRMSAAHPILFLRHRSPNENVPMVSGEEIIDLSESEKADDDGSVVHSGEKPYPPMPKSALAQRGRIDIPEEMDEEEEFLWHRKRSMNPLGREGREGGLGWEPKLALRYIRQLKTRKRDESFPLRCLICKNKSFTALATLMYHYRSHAGIKPFVCLICNTTFTRQHSLNYHMLIHNNQSRFTCQDCGRKFRHPSHFKEHLRRHTGETPFECLDCTQKFKTRNTYKRHLKTRHGKLLTASGIHQLSMEEFMKVRTKPYMAPNPMNKAVFPYSLYSKRKGRRLRKNVDVDLTQMDASVKQEPLSDEEGKKKAPMSMIERNPDHYISKIERKVLTIGLPMPKPKQVLEQTEDGNQVIVHVV